MSQYAYPPELAIPPLLGRAGSFDQAKTFQLFARIEDDNGALVLPDEGALTSGPGWFADYLPQGPIDQCIVSGRRRCERLWRISTATQAIWRTSQVDIPALLPAQFAAADLGNFSAALAAQGALLGGSGWFRIRVRISDNTGSRVFTMDLDEIVETYGTTVQAEIVGPPGAILITDFNDADSPAPALLNGQVLIDLRVGASIMPIESPVGLFEPRYTQLVAVPIATEVRVPVPRFARRVKVWQSTAGAGAGPWLREAGGSLGSVQVGQLNFVNRQTADEELGRESFLITDGDLLVDRVFVVQWTIVP